jgi:hypothetical protein
VVVVEAPVLDVELALDETLVEVDELLVPPVPPDELDVVALGSAPGQAVSSKASAAGIEYQNSL